MALQTFLGRALLQAANIGCTITRGLSVSPYLSMASHHHHRIKCRDYIPPCSKKALARKTCNIVEDLEKLDCCINPCKWAFPSFDSLYYKPSNKNRKYARTWCEFAGMRIAPKQLCCFEQFDYRKPKRRRPKRPKFIKSVPIECMMRKLCRNSAVLKCSRVNWPGCRTTIKCKAKCIFPRDPSDCKKRCTPYPSFSECKRDLPKPTRPIECKCLQLEPFCR